MRRDRRIAYLVFVALVFASALTATAAAQAAGSGGSAPAPSGGATQPSPAQPAKPVLTNVQCTFNRSDPCVETHRVESGGAIALRGRNLAAASSVIFYGNRGRSDDVTVPTAGTAPNYAKAQVPTNARSGPVAVLTASGPRSARWSGLVVEDPVSELRPYRALLSAPVEATLSQPRRIYFGGVHKAVFTYRTMGQQTLDVQANLVRASDGATVRSWLAQAVPAGAIERIAWDGTDANGKPLPADRYSFQVTAPGAGATAAAAPPKGQSIALQDFVFPVLGSHTYNLTGGRFGAPRPGRTHQGQDVLARCGAPLVAARGGKVLYAGFQSLAGYYLTIDGQGTGYDFAYMHLREPAMIGTGDRVYTGQQIGYVGDTGDATACHLHFEMWTAPGWYRGGHAIDPLPSLQRWDRAT